MPERVLLDTHIFITGHRNPATLEGQVLHALRDRSDITLLLSFPLEDQIRRVARRIGGKDWAGLILSRVWHDFLVEYVALPADPQSIVENLGLDIPREDWLIFLTALMGETNLLVSGNREFLRQAAAQQNLFTCLTPAEFLIKLTHD